MGEKLSEQSSKAGTSRAIANFLIIAGSFLLILTVMGSLLSATMKGKVEQVEANISAAEEAFITAHSDLHLLPALARESVTAEGLNSELASSLCLNSAEANGAEILKAPISIFSNSSGDDVYSVYPTEDNDVFYVRLYLEDDSELLCKASGTSESPKTEILS